MKINPLICYIVIMDFTPPDIAFSSPLTRLAVRRIGIFPALSVALLLASAPLASADGPHPLDDNASELISRGDYAKALEQLRRTFSLFPYDESARKNLTAAYATVGKRQLERMEYDEAAENFVNAKNLAPDNQEYGMLRGIALYLGRHYDAALVELELSRRNGGDNLPLLFFLGRVYYDTGDLSRAVEMWEMALAIEPDNKALRDLTAKARREIPVESGMSKGHSPMFEISYDGGIRADLADAVLDALETAYNRVGYDLSYYPASHVPVILYTKKDFRSVTAGPDWSGGLYDGKVRLPIGGTSEITPPLRAILSHEYTHVVVGELTKGNCPVWLNEGLAEFEGRKDFAPSLSRLAGAAKTGALFSFSSLEKSFKSLNAGDAALAYQQSYSMADFIISAYGWHKVREILVNLGTGMGPEASVKKALADYSLDFKAITEEWRTHLQKEYGAE